MYGTRTRDRDWKLKNPGVRTGPGLEQKSETAYFLTRVPVPRRPLAQIDLNLQNKTKAFENRSNSTKSAILHYWMALYRDMISRSWIPILQKSHEEKSQNYQITSGIKIPGTNSWDKKNPETLESPRNAESWKVKINFFIFLTFKQCHT